MDGAHTNVSTARPAGIWGGHGIIVLLLILTVSAGLIRSYRLGERSLWYDEAATINNVRQILHLPASQDEGLMGMMAKERVPPLYFFWVIPFYGLSRDDGFLRIASLIWGIATIPLFYVLATRLFRREVALAATLLLATSPFHVFYSQDLRPYSFFLFLSVLFFHAAWLALTTGRSSWFFALVAAATLGFYTHTYFLFPVLIVNVCFLLNWRLCRPLLPKWILAHAILFCLWLPGLYHAWFHMTRGNTRLANRPPGPRVLFANFYLFTVGRFLFPSKTNIAPLAAQAVLFAAGCLLGLRAIWKERTGEQGRHRFALFLAAAVAYAFIVGVSLTFLPLLDEARVNYVIFLLPFFFLLVSAGWYSLGSRRVAAVCTVAAVLLGLFSLWPFFFRWDEVGKGDFRSAALYLRGELKPGDGIFHTRIDTTYPFNHYMGWEVPQVQLGRVKSPDFNRNERVWLVVFEPEAGLEFGRKLLQQERHASSSEENERFREAREKLESLGFRRVLERSYPGKNEIVIYLYGKQK